MAKQFAGFTPEQMGKIIPEMQGMQADEQAKFLAAQPGAAARVGKMAKIAQKRIGMASGGYVNKQGYAAGGITEDKVQVQPGFGGSGVLEYTTGQEVFQPGYTPDSRGPVDVDDFVGGPALPPEPDAPDYARLPAYLPDPGYGTKPGETPITSPVEPPVIDDGPTPSPAPQQAIKGTVTFETPEGSYNFVVKRKTMVDGSTRMLYTVKDAKGSIVATDLTGSDMQKWAVDNKATPRDVYDPSKGGLPTSPEGVAEAAYTPFLEQVAGGSTGNGAEYNIPGITKMLSSGNVPEDPTDYEITGSSENWTITYTDGTTLKSIYNSRDSIVNEAVNIANVLQQYKESDAYTANTAVQERYNTELDQYKTYSGDQAGASLDDTSAGLDAAQRSLSQEQNLAFKYAEQISSMADDDPQREVLKGLIDDQQLKVKNAKDNLSLAQTNVERVGMSSTTELRASTLEDPMSQVTEADVVTTTPEQRAAGKIAEGTGQAAVLADQATVTTADTAADVGAPVAKEEATYDATKVLDRAKEELDRANAATEAGLSAGSTFLGEQGTVSPEAQASEINTVAEDRINKVNENVNLEVTKLQLAEAKGSNLKAIEANIAQSDALREAVAATSQVQPEELPPAAIIAADQMAQAVAMTDAGLSTEANPVAAKLAKFSVDNGTLALAMAGEVKALATVEGQLSQLMKDFDDGTPAWAAGAMRAANAVMASRGIGASSMASAAILQAAMESALPIAQQDASTFAQMGMQNLNNQQQVALSNAAAQQGLSLQNLSNEQQANLQRSAQAFSLQTTNLSNRQAAEIANAQIRATLQGQNLNNEQQSNIAIAARYAEQANVNLNNKQQASMQTNANQLQTNIANLSSKSQAYITNANLASSLQGQVLSNEQQVSIQKAARYSEAANITFTSQQQNALHNSKMMQTIGLAELDANMAATLQNAATFAGMDMANLNNRQQAASQNAKAFLELDMTNLNNEQQMAMFKAQATQQALLSDQAAENAAKQFNAASENQTNQFYDNLTTQVAMQNQEQTNAMNKFNAGEANAISQSNSAQQNARDQFNANNALVVEQANAVWEQAITTTDNAAQNQANRDSAQEANGLTETTYNNMLQQERDVLDYVWRSAESVLSMENNLTIAEMQSQATVDTARGEGAGVLLNTSVKFLLNKLL